MPYDFQVVVDSADPHPLADWWAETLDWEVEKPDEDLIRRLVAGGQADEADTTTHDGRLVWRVGAAIRHPEPYATGNPRRVLFQVVPESKSVKNRVHLDVFVGSDRIDEVRDALVARGATFLHSGRQGPFSWHTLADIEGNEFCVS
jgi:hypothetical protein